MERIADGIWGIECTVAPGPGVHMKTRTTVVRKPRGGLWLHSPCDMDDATAAEVDALGAVEEIVAPNLFHHLFLADALRRWPGATLHGPPGLAEKRQDLDSCQSLAPSESWLDCFRVLAIDGMPKFQEYVFYHQPSRTLVATDLVFNEPEGMNLSTRIFFRLFGTYGKLAVSRPVPDHDPGQGRFRTQSAAVDGARHRARGDGARKDPGAVGAGEVSGADRPVRRSMSSAVNYIAISVALLVAALVGWAAAQGGLGLAGWPVVAWCMALAFVVQWLVFVPAWLAHTEHYFDLTGSLTYLSVALLAAWAGNGDARSLLIAGLVAVWALRLGTFLFARVRKAGEDRRFARMKHDFSQFLMTWTLQGLWVSVTFCAGLAAMTAVRTKPLGLFAACGGALWLVGFGIEVVADRQKQAFRADPSNADSFVTSGLWSWSRHPNYFGEIVLWIGIAVISAPVLEGWQRIALVVSPVFVVVLLTQISGVRMLEVRADRRWGDDPEYQRYKKRTSVLVPLPPR